ncbi:MAG TPA: NAD-dependent deacylase [Nitrospiria bacterium]|nr:NAD-dependent deacylase [Nitrospiria bacterium]
MDPRIADLQALITGANRVTALTGAGISAESGIPTFRGPEGLWNNYRPEELATPEAFARDPELVWRWYDWRRGIVAKAKPNAAHTGLAALQQRQAVTVITQNVDGLHGKAGSRELIELHGNIWKVRCTSCAVIATNTDVPLATIPPSCKSCGALVRPHIVWFGESVDPYDFQRSVEMSRSADVFLVIGTSGLVQPAASFAQIAKSAGAAVVEINPDDTPTTPIADLAFRERAVPVFEALGL